MKSQRVLIAPHEIASYYRNLSRGLRDIGLVCDFVPLNDHAFAYHGESRQPVIVRAVKYLNRTRKKIAKHHPARYAITFVAEFMRSLWALYAVVNYDVFIFGFGESLLRKNMDLYILRAFRKLVIANLAHGSEARPPYLDGAVRPRETTANLRVLARKKKLLVQRHELHVDYMIGAPFSTSQFATMKFINTFAIGLPAIYDYPVTECQSDLERLKNIGRTRCRVLHAPSDSMAKGTSGIVKAVANLQAKGLPIDLILVQNRTHAEVLCEIRQCDFVIDQLYSDTPMAGFAVEAAWFGKPAVIGGYGFCQLQSVIPKDMWPPSKLCHPDDIEGAIESMVFHPDERAELGKLAQDFVRGKWHASEVARRYARIINGDIPGNWWLDPKEITYLEGIGQPVEHTKASIRKLIAEYSLKSLQLSHRPDLELAALCLVNDEDDVRGHKSKGA